MKIKEINIYKPIEWREYWKIFVHTTSPKRLYLVCFENNTWYLDDNSQNAYYSFDLFAKKKRLPYVVRNAIREKMASEVL